MTGLPMGLHVQGAHDAHDAAERYIRAVRPPVVKFLDDAPPRLVDLVHSYGGLTILRFYWEPQDPGEFGPYLRAIERRAAGTAVKAVEVSFNEAMQEGDALVAKAELDVAGMKLAERIGKIAVIGCFSVGMPDLRDSDPGIQWRHYAPALRYAAEHGHLLGLHEYGGGPLGMDVGVEGVGPGARGWYGLRYRRVLDWARSIGLPMPRIVICEAGIDDLAPNVMPKTPGYQTARDLHPPGVGDYAAQAARYARHLAEDKAAVVGWVDFGFGGRDEWAAFDLSRDPAMLDRMIAEMRALHEPPAQEPPMADLGAMLAAEFGPALYEDLRKTMADRPGFTARPLSGVEALAVHHTASSRQTSWTAVRDGHWAKGWSGIGYHLGIRMGKVAYLGDVGQRRACVADNNHRLICLVLTGDYTKTKPDPGDLALARRVVKVLDAFMGRKLLLRGHSDFLATACPGALLYSEIQGLRSGAVVSPPASRPNKAKIAWFAEDAERRMRAEGLLAEAEYWARVYTAKALEEWRAS